MKRRNTMFSGNWFKDNWKWMVLIVLFALMMYFTWFNPFVAGFGIWFLYIIIKP